MQIGKSSRATVHNGLKQAAMRAVAGARLFARCVSCYVQLWHEHNELARLNYHRLRDIGLTPSEVEEIIRGPIWRRCWRCVRSCPNQRCLASTRCIADCRINKRANSIN